MTFIYHSHKILDGEVCAVMSAQQNLIFRYVDLARERLSYGLLLDLTGKMPHWQSELVDPKFLDHSIKDAEREFMILNTPAKINFLYNNQWGIGTPVLIDEESAIRFINVEDVRKWLKSVNALQEVVL